MRFLRYPGGKSKLLSFLINYLPNNRQIKGTYIEPFIGGGSVFFHIQPNSALISDLNTELITLYKGIKLYPYKVWETFESFPSGKVAYYQVRDKNINSKPLYYKAARTLYLNRTCFKGMWRHNNKGDFNVGYGGEERRWVITNQSIIELSKIFRKADILNSDFENVISNASKNDFIFLDPPYKPGEKHLNELHYCNGRFLFEEQVRLAETLKSLPKVKRIHWAMTNSSHKDILKLYKRFKIIKIPFGTSDKPGIQTKNSGEVLITNY
ncbi:MAG: Dam family site-specific DNA-(adenine-N6)-methyltransferase [Bacteroidota bacterium]|nr:Dam family site-specific DNA-(adenine-N6)-methyltransferase [Flavisolibacter sp.]MDQ3843424.1 Dam family site-specific DNA-(adenine-N6)-methyltransferase [Bacteroidota bacterium]